MKPWQRSSGEVQKLLHTVEISTHTGLRDRALLATLAYTFARIGSVVNLKVEDYYPSGKRFLLRFKEKGGKEKELPVHHKLEEMLDQYLKATGLEKEPESPLFPAALRKTGKLSRRPLVRTDAADMLKRRLKQAGLPAHYSPHSFRATDITNFLVSWTEEETESKAVHKNFGDHPSGSVTFTSDGRMMIMFVDPAGKPPASPKATRCRSCSALPDDGGLCRQVPYRGR